MYDADVILVPCMNRSAAEEVSKNVLRAHEVGRKIPRVFT